MPKISYAKPDYENSIVNLMSSLIKASGGKSKYKELDKIFEKDLKSKNIVLFVIDGLGYDYVKSNKGFMNKNLKNKITTVFPSSTAIAVTTFMTGDAPQQHALTGWSLYDKENTSIILPLPFMTRPFHMPAQLMIDPKDFYHQKSIFSKIKRKSYIIYPNDIEDSAYTISLKGKAEVVGYKDMKDFFKKIKIVSEKKGNKLIFAYWSEFDTICHALGKKSKLSGKEYKKLDNLLYKTVKKLKNTTIIVTGDHGHIDVKKSNAIDLEKHPKLLDCLIIPPTGESRAVYFYVRPAKAKQFEDYVKKKFSDKCWLYKSNELIKERYFGLFKQNKKLAERIGDYVMIMKERYVVKGIVPQGGVFVGNHGGMSEEEMFVPLIVIKT